MIIQFPFSLWAVSLRLQILCLGKNILFEKGVLFVFFGIDSILYFYFLWLVFFKIRFIVLRKEWYFLGTSFLVMDNSIFIWVLIHGICSWGFPNSKLLHYFLVISVLMCHANFLFYHSPLFLLLIQGFESIKIVKNCFWI